MSNTISRTLKNEETSVGLGLLSMFNFISGASVVGKLFDRGSASFKLHPLTANEAACDVPVGYRRGSALSLSV